MKHSTNAIIITILSVLPALNPLRAQSSNIVIEVEAARIVSTSTPDSTALEQIPGLTLRQQGRGNPQTDLSIRGSSFSSAGLILAGLSLRNAQTEHWHASIATPSSWLESSSVLTGLDRFRLSAGHPAGSVALSLAPLLSDESRLTAGGGSHSTIFGGAEITRVEHLPDSTVGATAFTSYNHADQTDSISGNYLDRFSAGGRLSRLSDKTQADLLATISYIKITPKHCVSRLTPNSTTNHRTRSATQVWSASTRVTQRQATRETQLTDTGNCPSFMSVQPRASPG